MYCVNNWNPSACEFCFSSRRKVMISTQSSTRRVAVRALRTEFPLVVGSPKQKVLRYADQDPKSNSWQLSKLSHFAPQRLRPLGTGIFHCGVQALLGMAVLPGPKRPSHIPKHVAITAQAAEGWKYILLDRGLKTMPRARTRITDQLSWLIEYRL